MTTPTPPRSLVVFNPDDWPLAHDPNLFGSTGTPQLQQREQWRQAREHWGQHHGLDWGQTLEVLTAARTQPDATAPHPMTSMSPQPGPERTAAEVVYKSGDVDPLQAGVAL